MTFGGMLVVDDDLVRELVQSGSAAAIEADQAAKALVRQRKHCESMIRYRRKKKVGFADMKTEAHQLTAQLQRLLRVHIDAKTADTGDESPPILAARRVAIDSFIEIVALSERLQHENALLRRRVGDLNAFQHVVRDAHAIEATETADAATKAAKARKALATQPFESPGSGRWVRFLEHDEPFYFVPFAPSECCAIASATLEKIYAHQLRYVELNEATTAVTAVTSSASTHKDKNTGDPAVLTLFDWTASLAFEWDDAVELTMIRYRFTKTFRHPQLSVEQLVAAEYDIFTDDALFERVHRVPVRSQLLQHVNDHMSVRLWNAPTPKKSLRFRNVSLFTRSRFTNANGRDCGIVTVTGVQLKRFREQGLQSLDAYCKQHARPRDNDGDSRSDDDDDEGDSSAVYTHGGFIYMSFALNESGDMDVEFGGRVDITSAAQGRFLMVELGGTVVRLEQLLFPLRVLQTSWHQ